MADRATQLFLKAVFLKVRRWLPGIMLAGWLSGCTSLFFYPDKQTYITPDQLGLDYQSIHIPTPDGETLHAWWLPATGQPAKGSVYFLHGNAQNISAHLLNVAWLAEVGFNVFLLDYRGFGESSGDPDLAGALLDAETGLRWLHAHHPDPPLFVLGQSLGGAIAIDLMADWQAVGLPPPQGLVIDAAFSGFRSIAREKLDAFWLTWPLQIPLSWTISAAHEPIDAIASISPTPLLLIHSQSDTVIPFHHGQQLYAQAQEPKTLIKTDTPHTATFLLPHLKTQLLDFFAQETFKSSSQQPDQADQQIATQPQSISGAP